MKKRIKSRKKRKQWYKDNGRLIVYSKKKDSPFASSIQKTVQLYSNITIGMVAELIIKVLIFRKNEKISN